MTLPKYCDALNGHCHIEKIIVSLSLPNLFLPNSNLFPLNSNIADKNQLSTPTKDRCKNNVTSYNVLRITLAARGLEEPCASFPDFFNNHQFHIIILKNF